MSDLRLGLDIGGTKMLALALDADDRVIRSQRIATSHDRTRLLTSMRDLVDDFGASEMVGIGVPGPVTAAGVVEAAPNLPCLVGLDRDDLADALGRPVALGNDAKCATLAEWRVGAGEGVRDFVLLAMGTGIGAGLVVDGRLHLGAAGFAGEVGHMIVDPNGPECGCGQRGCWERVASGAALTATAQRGFREGWLPALSTTQVPSPRRVTGEDLVQAARTGDEACVAAVDDLARWIAVGLVNILNVLDPERVVIAGGLADAADVLVPRVVDWRDRLWNGFGERRAPAILAGTLGDRAGAIGAALLGAIR